MDDRIEQLEAALPELGRPITHSNLVLGVELARTNLELGDYRTAVDLARLTHRVTSADSASEHDASITRLAQEAEDIGVAAWYAASPEVRGTIKYDDFLMNGRVNVVSRREAALALPKGTLSIEDPYAER